MLLPLLAHAMVIGLGTPPGYHHVQTVGGWEILTNDNDSGSCVMAAGWDDGTILFFGPSKKADATVLTVAQRTWTEEDVGQDLKDAKLNVSFGDDLPSFDLPAIAYHVGQTYMVGGVTPGLQFIKLMSSRPEISMIVGPRGSVVVVPLRGSRDAVRAVANCEGARMASAR